MSKISDQVRAYVADPDVSDHYGAWGALRPDQRRLIRNLCDVCDMYEKTADLAVAEREANVKGFTEELKKLTIELEAMRTAANSYKMHYESAKSEVIDEFVKRLKDAPIKCAFPLFGLTTKTEIELYFNDIMLQFGDAIDRIAKEMKGDKDTDDANKVSSGDICVVCGEPVPEGRQICSMCEVGQEYLKKRKGEEVGK